MRTSLFFVTVLFHGVATTLRHGCVVVHKDSTPLRLLRHQAKGVVDTPPAWFFPSPASPPTTDSPPKSRTFPTPSATPKQFARNTTASHRPPQSPPQRIGSPAPQASRDTGAARAPSPRTSSSSRPAPPATPALAPPLPPRPPAPCPQETPISEAKNHPCAAAQSTASGPPAQSPPPQQFSSLFSVSSVCLTQRTLC